MVDMLEDLVTEVVVNMVGVKYLISEVKVNMGDHLVSKVKANMVKYLLMKMEWDMVEMVEK